MTQEKALAIFQPTTYEEVESTAKMMVASGYFPNVERVSQAGVKIMMGAELGFNAVVSMKSIHIIDGKPTIGGDLIASKIKSSGKYRYTIAEHTAKGCAMEFFERVDDQWEFIGTSSFTEEDAKLAGLLTKKNWQKYPKNMYFNRAIANGQRWFCPDLFDNGGTVYTPDELDAEVDANDNIIEGDYTVNESHPEEIVAPLRDKLSPSTDNNTTWDEELIRAIASLMGTADYVGVEKGLQRNLENGTLDGSLSNKELFGVAWRLIRDQWLEDSPDLPLLLLSDERQLAPYQIHAAVNNAASSFEDEGTITLEQVDMFANLIHDIVGYDTAEDARNALVELTTFLFIFEPGLLTKAQARALQGWLTFTTEDGSFEPYPTVMDEIGNILEHRELLAVMLDSEEAAKKA